MLENCKFANEKAKRNCARLGLHRDFNLLDSYTIESSCFGYHVKGTGRPPNPEINDEGEEGDIEQFTTFHLLEFGKELMQCLCK